jgi:hypothetical protein
MAVIEEKAEDNGTIYMDKIKVQVNNDKQQHRRRESEVVSVNERR